jgi:hypothetical protein
MRIVTAPIMGANGDDLKVKISSMLYAELIFKFII